MDQRSIHPTPPEASTRRRFVGRATAVAAFGSTLSAYAKRVKPTMSARSASRVVGANDRINLGLVGLGMRGVNHLRHLTQRTEEVKDVQTTAVSDLYTRWKKRATAISGLQGRDIHHDYRELLERSDVDAVIISTPDHWHAQMAVDAMTADKDVYLEKPMTLTIDEAQQVAEMSKKTGHVLQIGSGGVSDPKYKKARELIEGGEIGDLLWAQASMGRFTEHGDWNYHIDKECTPENVDWKRWLGSAASRPFSAERFSRWRKYWDYSGGIATDLYYHTLGPILYVMGAQFPTRVVGAGGIYVHKNREVPDNYATIIEYPKFYILISGTDSSTAPGKHLGRVIYGSKGTLSYQGRNVVIEPLSGSRSRGVATPEPKMYEAGPYDNWATHIENFLTCMRTRQKPNLNGDLGFKIMVPIKLGVDSYREGRVGLFDPQLERIAWSAPPRDGYEGDGRDYAEFKQFPGDR